MDFPYWRDYRAECDDTHRHQQRRMYISASNGYFAIDAITGAQIWKYDATQTTERGVSYWPGDAKFFRQGDRRGGG